MKSPKILLLVAAVAATLQFPVCGLAQQQSPLLDVQTCQLTNGMKVLLLEDHSIPNVALYFFHRVGSRNEHTGITGLSHFFEHMMFNGAEKYGPKMFDRVMEDAGGANNAYTCEDLTVYQDWFPSTALPLIFDMEADRTSHLAFDPQMVESERGVVTSERRLSVENNNDASLQEQLQAAAFTAHPYHWPVIGWMVDIQNWKRQDLVDYYKIYYAPNNCEMVIVGDFQTNQVIELARKFLEPIPAQPEPRPVTTQEPEQNGERRVFLHRFAQLPSVQVAYHIPASRDADSIALEVLDYLLLRGESSRLYQRLVDKEQAAISVSGGQSPHLDPFLFEFAIQPRAGVDVAQVEKLLYEELEKLQTTLVSSNELQKVKNTAVADFYRSIKTINGKANALGTYDIVYGDYHRLFQTPELINQVTPEQLQTVAKKYFTLRNRTVAILVPDTQETTAKH
jgi:zinc protease